ncbi:hypothetical protein TthWC1_1571 [Thermoanaerobacter thermohydrosulfuricus WC1]|jgi:hypothetical protein|uniref:Holin n=2 Tax=Thermoanaerobacter TaxID=1754 RepID=D3T327_THEIA|nr:MULTISPECIES: hypothetical protein [Thermoanaerobacter]ADD02629.1 conserved hypothetical protein [Thermoanaerobacter italicus Ab9]EMT38902.1 hypothetical protein TthWC1_1571 [Thermoanaerobacter thermohydrosulfuricus WC1]
MDMQWWGIPAIPIIIGITELAKQVGLPKKYAGFFSVVVGIIGGIAISFFGDSEVAKNIVSGLVAGLTAVGLWSGTKNTIEALKEGK